MTSESRATPSPGRATRIVAGLAAGAMVVAVLFAVGLWLWSSHAPCQQDDSVVDKTANVCFAVPDGWRKQTGREFVLSITSLVSSPEDPGGRQGAAVVAGRWRNFFEDPPDRAQLVKGTRSLAASFAEYFHPSPGQRREPFQQARLIDDHRAATVSFTIDFDGGSEEPVYVRCTVVEVRPGRFSFVFGSTPARDRKLRGAVDAIHDDLAINK